MQCFSFSAVVGWCGALCQILLQLIASTQGTILPNGDAVHPPHQVYSITSPNPQPPERVLFIAPPHTWNPPVSTQQTLPRHASIPKSDASLMNEASGHRGSSGRILEHIEGPYLSRPRRKVFSKGLHYILRKKSSQDGVAGPGTYSNVNPHGGYSGGGGHQTDKRLSFSRSGSSRHGGRNRHHGGRRGSLRRGGSRKKINQVLKMEIGQYALQKGAAEAAVQYEGRVGRRLKERIIEKFARRFRLRQERRLERMKEGKTKDIEEY